MQPAEKLTLFGIKEVSDIVLATITDKDGNRFVETDVQLRDNKWHGGILDFMNERHGLEVIAWMPKPEPYEGE